METINQRINQLFIATDQKDWTTVESCFAPHVRLDYSSMNGQSASDMTPQQITNAWKTILPGFTHTHHQVGNFFTSISETSARVFCYGTATHYLVDEAGSIWTVVGSYDFDLEVHDGIWKITKMTFNFKYQDGNIALVQKAIENAKP